MLSQLRRVSGCRGVLNTPHRRPCGAEWRSCYGGFWGRRLEIRICFSNGVYIPVGDTGMFSPPAGGVCGAYAIRPYTCYMPYIKIRIRFSNGVYIPVGDTDMFSPPAGGVCGAYAIRPYTCYTSYIKIRPCFPNRIRFTHRNSDMFSEPGTRYPSKYGRVFRRGYT